MNRFTIAVAVAAIAASPAMAQFPGQTVALQPSMPGDAALTCEQILAEANPLNTIVSAQNQANAAKAQADADKAAKAANGRRIGAGLMGGALAGAAQFGMMRGALNNPLARQAVLAASQGASNVANSAGAAPTAELTSAAPPSVEQQRMTVLLGLYQTKKCG